jgi:preprotein translocase subunit YajC
MVVPFALIFYFLMYRPQKKKQQQHEKMIASIGRGDTVITAGGFFGKVSEVLEDSYIIELGDGVKARILKGSVSSKREGGEDKSRPRKLKKRKRERPKTATEEIASQAPAPSPEPAPTSPSSKALEEGVSIEEHAALFEGIVERQTDEPDALQKPKDD